MGCGSSKSTEVGGKANGHDKPTVKSSDEQSREPDAAQPISQLELLRESCLRAHNKRRDHHGAGPLILSDELNDKAQKWAEHLGKTGKFEHSTGGDAGENLAGHSNISMNSGEVITDMWYDEIKLYDFNKQGFSMATGHFTQVVWKSTEQIGVGMARNEKLGMYVFVANYRPAGNVMGNFEANVQPA